MRSLVMRRFMGRNLVMCRLRLRRLVMGCCRMRYFMMRGFAMRRLVVCFGMHGLVIYCFGMSACGLRPLVVHGFGLRPLVMHGFGLPALVMHGFGLPALMMYGFGLPALVMYSRGLSSGVGLHYGVRVSLIDRVVLVTIASSCLHLRALRCCRLKTTIARCRLFRGGWSRLDSARAIKADVIINRFVVDHCPVNVGVMDDRRIDVPRRRVISKAVALPSAAVETGSVIAVPIIDTSVESNVGAPITAVPTIITIPKSPVTRGPIISRVRNLNPRTGDPEITVISVGPVAGTPKISVLRTRRLLVDDERRWRNCNRESLSKQRRRCGKQKSEEDRGGFHQSSKGRCCCISFVSSRRTSVQD